jgi:hypothetical protein
LFKGLSSTKTPSLSKTMPSSFNSNKPPQPPPSPKTNITKKSPSSNIDDDFTSDLDALIERKQHNKLNNTSNFDKKPPLANQQQPQSLSSTMPAKKSALNFDLDDDDFSSNRTQPNKTKSLADELFSKTNNSQAEISNSTEFKLSDKYTKMSQESAFKNMDDDAFGFGGYVPSAVTPRSSSNGPAKRSTNNNNNSLDDLFNADLFATTGTRPKTSPAQGSGGSKEQPNLMRTMPTPAKSSADDWLGLSNNSKKDSIFDEMMIKPKLKPQPTPQTENVNKSGNFNDKDSEILGSEYSLTNRGAPRVTNMDTTIRNEPRANNNTNKLPFQSVKDSMNSSFADSVDVAENVPSRHTIGLSNQNNKFSSIFDPISTKKEENVGGSMAPSETEDGWLTNLMNKKSTSANNLTSSPLKKMNVIFCFFLN